MIDRSTILFRFFLRAVTSGRVSYRLGSFFLTVNALQLFDYELLYWTENLHVFFNVLISYCVFCDYECRWLLFFGLVGSGISLFHCSLLVLLLDLTTRSLCKVESKNLLCVFFVTIFLFCIYLFFQRIQSIHICEFGTWSTAYLLRCPITSTLWCSVNIRVIFLLNNFAQHFN